MCNYAAPLGGVLRLSRLEAAVRLRLLIQDAVKIRFDDAQRGRFGEQFGDGLGIKFQAEYGISFSYGSDGHPKVEGGFISGLP